MGLTLLNARSSLQIVSGKVLDFSILTLILPAVVIHDLPDHLMGLLVPDTHDHHMSSPHTDTHLNLASLLSSEPHLSQGDQLQSLIWREAFLNICIFSCEGAALEVLMSVCLSVCPGQVEILACIKGPEGSRGFQKVLEGSRKF